MKKIGLAAIMALGLIGAPAHAFMIEPFLQYELGEDDSKNDITGPTMGARLAYTLLGLQLGAEYLTGTLEQDTGTATNDVDVTDISLFAGYEFPVLIRVYALYGLSNEAEIGSTELKGSGAITLGLSYTGLPFVHINVEQRSRTYDEVNGASAPDQDVDTTVIGLSIPLP